MTDERTHRQSSGTGGSAPDWWDRWWPRVLAVVQLTSGVAILAWETTHAGDRLALQFWGVSLMLGAPATGVAVRLAAERLGGKPSSGGGS